MKKFFINRLFDIFTVSKALTKDGYTCDASEAFLRFKADVEAGKAEVYNTGDALPGFDFAGAKAAWEKLSEADQKQAIEDYDAFVDGHYRDLCAAFAEGREAVDALARKVTA